MIHRDCSSMSVVRFAQKPYRAPVHLITYRLSGQMIPRILIDRLKKTDYEYRERQVPNMNLFQVFVEDPNGITIELNYWGEDEPTA